MAPDEPPPIRRNVIFHGDSLDVLLNDIPPSSADMIYLDPPALAQQGEGTDQLELTEFELSRDADRHTLPPNAAFALGHAAPDESVAEYLRWLAYRTSAARDVLKPSGSLFFHTSASVAAYVRVLLDHIFGAKCFINEIVWARGGVALAKSRGFSEAHDTIFFYSRSENYKFNRVSVPVTSAQLEYFKNPDDDPRGAYQTVILRDPRPEQLARLEAENRLIQPPRPGAALRVKRFLSEVRGRAVSDVWADIPPLRRTTSAPEIYPTQKPIALLERMIRSATDPGDLVIDPFCGSGTALEAAERLGRGWIGVDSDFTAVALARSRLLDVFDPIEVAIEGAPSNLEAAQALARQDPAEFESWLLTIAEAEPVLERSKGFDGRIVFYDEPSGIPKQVAIEVKTGPLQVADVQDFLAKFSRHGAQLGALLTTVEPAPEVRQAAEAAGQYVEPVIRVAYPRLQVLSLAELLSGESIDHPGKHRLRDEETFDDDEGS